MADKDQDYERVKKACETLIEHFDTVQIFVTRHEASEGGTVNVKHGLGNYFARVGQVVDWLEVERESSRSPIVRKTAPEEESGQ